jgi:hypothetical protein
LKAWFWVEADTRSWRAIWLRNSLTSAPSNVRGSRLLQYLRNLLIQIPIALDKIFEFRKVFLMIIQLAPLGRIIRPLNIWLAT